jgi:Tol biopolymer transport system component
MGMNDNAPVRLTRGKALDWSPTWSPDGTSVAYTLLGKRSRVQDLVILNLQTGDRLRITIPGTSELEPNWQPL